MLLAIAVFVLHAPAEVVCAPNLQYPCINQFRQCLQSNNITVSRLCIRYKIMMWIVKSLVENTHFMFSKYRIQKFYTESFSKMYGQEETAEMPYSCAWYAFSL